MSALEASVKAHPAKGSRRPLPRLSVAYRFCDCGAPLKGVQESCDRCVLDGLLRHDRMQGRKA